jgi:hypothetical protein
MWQQIFENVVAIANIPFVDVQCKQINYSCMKSILGFRFNSK